VEARALARRPGGRLARDRAMIRATSRMRSDPPRVLIVDDDPAVRDILAAVLRHEGWNADAVSDGERAIESLQLRPYDAMILDLLMPRVDGTGVIAYVREQKLKMPVIVLSAVSKMQELDPNVVTVAMQKPFEISELRVVIRALRDSQNSV
jgi:DNA-binding response OmpR family regulator